MILINTNSCPLRNARLPTLLAAIFASLVASGAPLPVANLDRKDTVDYGSEVVPILKANCTACHNKTTTKGGLNMETSALMLKGGESGPAIVLGKGADSLLFQSAAHQADSDMPPKANKVGAVNLKPDELALLKLWIDQGAKAGETKVRQIAWQPLPPGLNPIYAVAMSPGGELAACSRANQVFIYDVTAKKQLAQFVAHQDMALALAFSPDGSSLASGSFGEVKLWKAGSALPAQAPTASLARSAGVAAMDVAFHTAEAAAQDKEIAAIQERLKKANDAITDTKKKLEEKRAALKTVADAKTAAQKVCDDASATLTKASAPADAALTKAHEDAKTKLAAAIKAETTAEADAKAAESAAKNAEAEPGKLNKLLASTQKLASDAKAELAKAQVSQKQLSADLAAATKTPPSASSNPLPTEWTLARTIGTGDAASPVTDRVNALAFSPDGKTLAVGSGAPSRDGDITFWDTETGKMKQTFAGRHSDTVLCLDWSPDGKLIASGGADKQLRVSDVASGKLLKTFEGHTHHVMGVSWRADGRVLATSGADNVVKVWDWIKRERRKNLDGWDKEVTSVRYLGATTRLITTSGDKQVRALGDDAASPTALPGTTDFMQSCAASGDGAVVAAGGEDSVLRIWTAKNNASVAEFPKPQSPP